MQRFAIITLLLVAMVLSACRSDVVYSESLTVNETGWSLDEPLSFDLQIDDTVQAYNNFVDLRVCRNYKYSNAFLFLTTTYPDGTLSRDTLECPLAQSDGRWLGKESGRYVDNRYYLKRGLLFPDTGNYNIQIIHGMRDNPMPGIKNVGLMMVKANGE